MRLVLFLILLFPGFLQARHKTEAELIKELGKTSTDTSRVNIICELSDLYFLTNADKARKHALVADQLATKINFPAGKALALNLVGYSHMVAGEFEQALSYYYQALYLGEQTGKSAGLARTYFNIGVIYRKLKDPARAIENYKKSLTFARKTQDSVAASRVYNSLGNIFEDEGAYAKALELFQRAAKIQEKADDKRNLATSLLNIGNVYSHLGQPENGLPYLFRSLRIHNEIQNNMIKIATLASIAKIYGATGRAEAALVYAKQSHVMALQTGSGKRIAASAKLLYQLYESRKNFEQAYKYLSVYQQQIEMLELENQKKQVAEMTIKYDTHRKDLENKSLKAETEMQEIEIQHQQMKLIFGGVVFLVMLVLMLMLYKIKLNLKTANKKLQEANLRMHLQNKEINRQKEEIVFQTQMVKRQNEQLEKVNIFKNKIFSIVSHDLRGPFVSMEAFLNLVQVKTLTPAETKPVFEMFSKEVHLVTNMINNLLVWSKAQLNGNKLNLEHFDLYFLAENAVEFADSQANKKNIQIINEIPDDTIVLTDKERLDFVLRNLLVNAIKFTPCGGEVRLQIIYLPDAISLVVKDNGMGIPDKFFSKLFTGQRFTTLGTAKEKGTGLGLLLCKELMESIQGEILVETQEGFGSSFSLILPKQGTVHHPVIEEELLTV